MAERDLSLDVAKGIGIILVVGGHCGLPVLGVTAYAFHMPFFFFISGYLFKRKETLSFLSGKVRGLVLPMYIYVFVYCLIYFLCIKTGLYPNSYPGFLRAVLLDPFLSAHGLPFTSALWFVACLFLSIIGFHFYHLLFRGNVILAALLGIGIVLTLVHVPGGANKIAYMARTAMAFGWICLGYTFRVIEKKIDTKYWIAISFTVFSLFALYSSNMSFEMVWNRYHSSTIAPLFFGLSASIFILSLSRYITGSVQGLLASLGRYSFHIMANHFFVFFALGLVLSVLLQDRSWFESIYSRPNDHVRFLYLFSGVFVPWFIVMKLKKDTCVLNNLWQI